MKKIIRTLSVILLALAILSGWVIAPPAQPVYAASGSGTLEDPYIITTLSEFNDMRLNLSAYYRLGNDIDASATADWDSGKGWTPIGSQDNPFTGGLDGNNYTISHLYINRTDETPGVYHAMFSHCEGAVIQNLTLEDFNITGRTLSATLAGDFQNGEIYNVHIEGASVTAKGAATAEEQREGDPWLNNWVYGLGNVGSTYAEAWGGDVASEISSKGPFFLGQRAISEGYRVDRALFEVEFYSAEQSHDTSIEEAYCGFYLNSDSTITDFDVVLVGMDGIHDRPIKGDWGITREQTTSLGSFSTADFGAMGQFYEFPLNPTGISYIQSRLDQGDIYFGLRSSQDIAGIFYTTDYITVGQYDSAHPYIRIVYNYEFADMSAGLAGDCSGIVENSSVDSNTIVTGSLVGGMFNGFWGSATDCASDAQVHAYVWETYSHGGGIVGGFAATVGWETLIENCHTNGIVTAEEGFIYYIGGFCGYNYGEIFACYSTSEVSIKSPDLYAGGGFVGMDNGSIRDCYSRGNITSYTGADIGGFVGFTSHASGPPACIRDCYSTGQVTTTGFGGGFAAGEEDEECVNQCFWDVETSGAASSAGGTGKTTAEMKTKDTFATVIFDESEGQFLFEPWNFCYVWEIDGVQNDGYPFLQDITTPVGPCFWWWPPTPEVGEEVYFSASNTHDPDEQIENFSWDFDDGTTSDDWGETYHTYEHSGNYSVTLTVTTFNNESVSVSKTIYIQASIPLIALTGNYWDYGTDTDGDGFFDYLTVDVEVILAEPGSCAISARLLDINEEEIAWTDNITELGAEQPQIIQLNFNGEDILNHGVDGPYYLRDVYVYHANAPTLPDYVYEAYTTSAYSYWQFGNLSPIADAGGPYSGEEGSPISLAASNSTDPNGDPLQYRWDFNNDGTWDTDWLSEPTVVNTWYDDYAGEVMLEVFDGELTDTATAMVNISNVNPTVSEIIAPSTPVHISTEISVNTTFNDPGMDDTHTALWDWGDDSTSEGTVNEAASSVNGTHTYSSAGIYTISLTVADDDGSPVQSVFQYIIVYNPEAGFVTGAGWIHSPEGAYKANPSLTGKANFGFNCKYLQGEEVPTGEIEFNFKEADLNLHSTNYEWLVIYGAQAIFRGEGTINGEGTYQFQVTAIDADADDGDSYEEDLFRIRIWDESGGTEVVIYDSGIIEPGGGSIQIHNS